jgi:predicted metal-dependent phosphotriesterase family hydrolase
LAAFGGTGFTFIADEFRRRLLAAGVTPDEFHAITVANPARALTPGLTSP